MILLLIMKNVLMMLIYVLIVSILYSKALLRKMEMSKTKLKNYVEIIILFALYIVK